MYINKICRNTEISVSIQNKLKKKSGTGNSAKNIEAKRCVKNDQIRALRAICGHFHLHI